jgi:hypothetical protein
MLGTIMLIQFRKFHFMVPTTLAAVFFSVLAWLHLHGVITQSHWTVYRVMGHRAMEWTANGESLFVADSSLAIDKQKIRFHILPNQLFQGVTKIHSLKSLPGMRSGIQFFRRGGKTFLWITTKKYRLPERVKVDYVVISNNSVGSVRDLLNHIDFKLVIFDSSNSYRYCEKLEKESISLNRKCYPVLSRGAFVLDI